MNFFREERAQASVEYILMLAFAVTLALLIFKGFLRPLFSKISGQLSQTIQDMYSGDHLHRLNFKVN